MKKNVFALSVLAMASLAAGQAMAQDQMKVTSPSKDFYVGLQAGWVIPEDVDFTVLGRSGKYEFNDGYSVGGLAGYQFNNYLRGEVSLTYAHFDYDRVSIDGIGSGSVDGDVNSTIGMVSAVVSPLGKTKVSPFFGGGVGAAYSKDKIRSVDGVSVDVSNSDTNLALSGLVGLEANLSDSVSLGLRYNYLWIDSGSNGTDNLATHNFSATATYKF